MERVIWKARDTPGSWEVLHTSQTSTSCLLSTSVYQVKVANSPNWPLKCKMQYMFDVVQYEVSESESSHPGVKPRTHGLSCQCSHRWATTTRQPKALTILSMAVCFSCVPSSHSVWYAFLSFTYNIKHVCMFQLRQRYEDIQFFPTVPEIERFCVESDLLSQAVCIQRIPTAVTIVWWFPVL